MPNPAFLIGTRFQDRAAEVAPDKAARRDGCSCDCLRGAFKGFIKPVETAFFEPGAKPIEFYCPGVGLVIDKDLELAAINGHRDRDE